MVIAQASADPARLQWQGPLLAAAGRAPRRRGSGDPTAPGECTIDFHAERLPDSAALSSGLRARRNQVRNASGRDGRQDRPQADPGPDRRRFGHCPGGNAPLSRSPRGDRVAGDVHRAPTRLPTSTPMTLRGHGFPLRLPKTVAGQVIAQRADDVLGGGWIRASCSPSCFNGRAAGRARPPIPGS